MSEELNKAITYFNADNLTSAKKWLKKVKANSYAKKKLEYGILLKEKKIQTKYIFRQATSVRNQRF